MRGDFYGWIYFDMRYDLTAIAGAILILAVSIYTVGGNGRYEFRDISIQSYTKLDTKTGEIFVCSPLGINQGKVNLDPGECIAFSLPPVRNKKISQASQSNSTADAGEKQKRESKADGDNSKNSNK